MRVFFAIFASLLIFLPLTASAVSLEDCSGPITCMCYPKEDYADKAWEGFDPFDPEYGTCIDHCKSVGLDALTSTGPSQFYEYKTTHWSLDCVVDGNLLSVEWGKIIDINDQQDARDEEETKDLTVPALGLDYPGLSNSVLQRSFWVDDDSKFISSNLLGLYIQSLYAWIIGAATIVAIVMIMVGGFQWSLARGNSSIVEKAKKRITQAVFGLVLLLGAYSIAFLIDPNLTVFETLDIEYIDRTEWYPLSEETLQMNYRTDISGETTPIQGIHLVLKAQNSVLNPDAVAALQTASDAFYEEFEQEIVVTSATRDVRKQVELFYDNCLDNPTKTCSPPTCNPAYGSSVLTRNSGAYTLIGELKNETSKSRIIEVLIENSNVANCPHTSTVAVDIWCNDGGGNFIHNPECQLNLAKVMTQNGFCRISSEAWHFEYNDLRVSSSCSTSNTSSYTRVVGGKSQTHTPNVKCKAWDFKNNYCTD